ncbi:MAG: hypothetical protein Q7S09_04160 [bacterium]|nr:hypothetical protein [bacterium]
MIFILTWSKGRVIGERLRRPSGLARQRADWCWTLMASTRKYEAVEGLLEGPGGVSHGALRSGLGYAI